jgi:hypothetical protein
MARPCRGLRRIAARLRRAGRQASQVLRGAPPRCARGAHPAAGHALGATNFSKWNRFSHIRRPGLWADRHRPCPAMDRRPIVCAQARRLRARAGAATLGSPIRPEADGRHIDGAAPGMARTRQALQLPAQFRGLSAVASHGARIRAHPFRCNQNAAIVESWCADRAIARLALRQNARSRARHGAWPQVFDLPKIPLLA